MNNHLISYCYGYIVSNLIMIATNWTGVLRVVDSFSIIMIFIVAATMITIKRWQKRIMQDEYPDNIQNFRDFDSTREVCNFRFLKIFVLSFNILNLFIYLRDANMNQWSIVPAAVLLFVLYLIRTSSKSNQYDFNMGSWENELSTSKRKFLYKRINVILSVAVSPIAVFILYGHPIVRTIAPFIILALLGGVSLLVNKKCFEK
jgi:membrane protein